jgi:hypothetical protein
MIHIFVNRSAFILKSKYRISSIIAQEIGLCKFISVNSRSSASFERKERTKQNPSTSSSVPAVLAQAGQALENSNISCQSTILH